MKKKKWKHWWNIKMKPVSLQDMSRHDHEHRCHHAGTHVAVFLFGHERWTGSSLAPCTSFFGQSRAGAWASTPSSGTSRSKCAADDSSELKELLIFAGILLIAKVCMFGWWYFCLIGAGAWQITFLFFDVPRIPCDEMGIGTMGEHIFLQCQQFGHNLYYLTSVPKRP